MPNAPRPSANSIAAHPVRAMLATVPATCFIGAWLTDIAYWHSYDLLWSNFSVWLLTVGLVVAALAVVVGVVGRLVRRRPGSAPADRLRAVAIVVVLVLSIVNAFVHSRDGYTAVVPSGIVLSTVVVALLALTAGLGAGFGSGPVYRDRVGVR